jgi:hypothetical protein
VSFGRTHRAAKAAQTGFGRFRRFGRSQSLVLLDAAGEVTKRSDLKPDSNSYQFRPVPKVLVDQA